MHGQVISLPHVLLSLNTHPNTAFLCERRGETRRELPVKISNMMYNFFFLSLAIWHKNFFHHVIDIRDILIYPGTTLSVITLLDCYTSMEFLHDGITGLKTIFFSEVSWTEVNLKCFLVRQTFTLFHTLSLKIYELLKVFKI